LLISLISLRCGAAGNADYRMARHFQPKVLRGALGGWDLSLLCFALLYSSHDLLGGAGYEARHLVEQLRDLRNNKLAHVERCALCAADLEQAVYAMDSFVAECLPEHWVQWVEASRGIRD
jgi:hypothetical protein